MEHKDMAWSWKSADVLHAQQPSVKEKRLVGDEVNATMLLVVLCVRLTPWTRQGWRVRVCPQTRKLTPPHEHIQ